MHCSLALPLKLAEMVMDQDDLALGGKERRAHQAIKMTHLQIFDPTVGPQGISDPEYRVMELKPISATSLINFTKGNGLSFIAVSVRSNASGKLCTNSLTRTSQGE